MREAPHRLRGPAVLHRRDRGAGGARRCRRSGPRPIAVPWSRCSTIRTGRCRRTEANSFGAEAFLGVATRAQAGCDAQYYEAAAFRSVGGRRLAELAVDELGTEAYVPTTSLSGMRIPILRETRMPAVVCEIGTPSVVVEHTGELAQTLTLAFSRWVTAPEER